MTKQKPIKCATCDHCTSYHRPGNTRSKYRCSHPEQEYIFDYFEKKRMTKMPGFLGYGSHGITIRTAPAWCPLKRGGKDDKTES